MMKTLICFAIFLAGCRSPTSATNLSSFLASLWDAPECEEFMSDAAWVVVEDKVECGNAICNLPREICMENAETALTEENRQLQCRALPQECLDAVNTGGGEETKVDSGGSSPKTTTTLSLSSTSTLTSTSTTTASAITPRQVKIIVATDPPSTPDLSTPIVESVTPVPEEFTTQNIDSIASSNAPLTTAEIGTTEEAESTPATPVTPISQEDICIMGRNMGRPGDGCHRTYSFFYDAKRKICSRMLYWGCGGNANRFSTKFDCETAAAHCDSLFTTPRSSTERPHSGRGGNFCDQPKPVGRFCGYREMYYYNSEEQTCRQFWFPGCRNEHTNNNIFNSAEECNVVARICNSGKSSEGDGDSESEVDQFERNISGDECQLQRSLGFQDCPTGGWVRKFFFDIDETICKSFWYQGCGGNANRFDSIIECREKCL